MSLFLMCYYAGPIYLTASDLGLHETAPAYRSPIPLRPYIVRRRKKAFLNLFIKAHRVVSWTH